MMKDNLAVVHFSKHGMTEKYARWIAEELNAALIDGKKAKDVELRKYSFVIFGGPIYAGKISGVDLLKRNLFDHLVVFTVGLSDPVGMDYADLDKSLQKLKSIPEGIFHFRGGIDYTQLSMANKLLLKVIINSLKKVPDAELTSENKALIETYGQTVDFSDRTAIEPLVAYVRKLVEKES